MEMCLNLTLGFMCAFELNAIHYSKFIIMEAINWPFGIIVSPSLIHGFLGQKVEI